MRRAAVAATALVLLATLLAPGVSADEVCNANRPECGRLYEVSCPSRESGHPESLRYCCGSDSLGCSNACCSHPAGTPFSSLVLLVVLMSMCILCPACLYCCRCLARRRMDRQERVSLERQLEEESTFNEREHARRATMNIDEQPPPSYYGEAEKAPTYEEHINDTLLATANGSTDENVNAVHSPAMLSGVATPSTSNTLATPTVVSLPRNNNNNNNNNSSSSSSSVDILPRHHSDSSSSLPIAVTAFTPQPTPHSIEGSSLAAPLTDNNNSSSSNNNNNNNRGHGGLPSVDVEGDNGSDSSDGHESNDTSTDSSVPLVPASSLVQQHQSSHPRGSISGTSHRRVIDLSVDAEDEASPPHRFDSPPPPFSET